MNILVVCQHFYPENFRINDICFELANRGHKVTVLTGLPNYPEGVVRKDYKGGKNRDETVNGVNIKRCFLVGRGKTIFMMGINYFSFFLFGTLKVFRLKKERYDAIYVYQLSPITMAWPGIVLKRIRKIPLIIHCLDQWPESVITGPISEKSILFKILYKISVWTYKQADIITISSKSFKEYFEKVLKIKASKKGLLYFPSYAENIYSQVGQIHNEEFDIVFAGNIGPAQSCETIVECAKILKNNKKIKFHIVGDGLNREGCVNLAEKYGLENIKFYGFHPIEEMQKYYKLADAFIITMVSNSVVNSTLPAKIQSYMLAAKPIFGAISGEVKQVVEEANCGLCTDSGNARELANIILNNYQKKELLNTWGGNGHLYYDKYFTKEKSIHDLEILFSRMMSSNE